ncbi:ADP-ribosylation/Crystallin J1 [Aspergillus pseudocaelatus]|uniref:ADP-ribosylhydrolase ARH3 n=1 Tax=Aspergillus pseudocaelatus TaxID=1825620 RepID=A0ABQ6W4C7_9EURO|nr:ADP-ribosylation/Crystallin J1 [Aspergillus pseudocaelatus]
MPPSLNSRTLGSIWGVCVGDALGGPVQFMDPGTFEPITGLEYVKPFHQPAGSYSDDGSMTLALAQSIIDSQGNYNHALSIQYFVDWFATGRFSTIDRAWDVGYSTRSALQSWRKRGTEDLQRTQDVINQKLDMEHRSGNGSLMRIAPIGLALWSDPGEARRVAREQSRVTHPVLGCLEACEVYTLLVCGILSGKSKEHICNIINEYKFTDSALTQRLCSYKTVSDWQAKSAPEMRSSGWVVDTLEVALWGFFKYDCWAEGALAVANLGGDADTAAAVYGGLAGAFYGIESIPTEWVDGMQNKGFIAEVAGKLSEIVSREVLN